MSDGIHSLYPGFVKLFYTVGTFEHTQTIPVKPFLSVSSTWYVEAKGDPTGVLWTTALAAYINAVKPLYPATATFTYAELWTMSTPEADPLWVDTAMLAVVGTAGGSFVTAGQVVFSGRSTAGGVVKLYFMESIVAVNNKYKPTYSAPLLAVASYLTGAGSWLAARDGGFWAVVPQVTSKTNDKLRKQRGLV